MNKKIFYLNPPALVFLLNSHYFKTYISCLPASARKMVV